MTKMEGKNPSHTAQFYNSFDNRGFSPSQVLAREGGQNAIDAGRGVGGLTEMHLHWLKVDGESKQQLLKMLNLEVPLRDRLTAYQATNSASSFCESIERLFSEAELNLLLIRDFNTCGLGGQWDRFDREDHFARLVCALNLDDKSEGDSILGGSYGLGKTTYSNSSQIQTVLYHSVFEPTAETNDSNRRLMVAGVYPRHEIKEQRYGGFAYFGVESLEDPGVAKPFENDQAEAVWIELTEILGRDDLTRQEDETGTDILILQPMTDFEEVKAAIEDFYWPAIVDRELSVKFFDKEGELHYPNPISRQELKPFIDLHKKRKNEEYVDSETLVVDQLRKRHDKKTGAVAFEAVPDGGESENFNNTVALMRNTGMVIDYAEIGADRFEPARGVFVAHEDVYDILIASENMAHSEWDVNSRRLDRVFGDEGKDVVRNINNSIKRRFQEFQKNLQPNHSSSRNEHGFFARLMSTALNGTKGDDKPPPAPPNPAAISLTRKSRADKLSTWNLKLTDNEHTPDKEFDLKVMPSIAIAGDTKKVSLARREIVIKSKDGTILDRGAKPALIIPFQRGTVFESLLELNAPGEFNYVVTCRCSAEIEVPDGDAEGDGAVQSTGQST